MESFRASDRFCCIFLYIPPFFTDDTCTLATASTKCISIHFVVHFRFVEAVPAVHVKTIHMAISIGKS